MRRVSTHVLDTARGLPAAGVRLSLERQEGSGEWRALAASRTDSDGRCRQLLPEGEMLSPGTYRLAVDTGSYYRAQGIKSLYPSVQIIFSVREGETAFHLPLLLNPYGYTTYQGS
jgi:5-hydroxyisourate hydrolase